MSTFPRRSFAGGEIAPSLYARCDLSKYETGLRTCRNFFVLRHGGASNRPGSQFIGEISDSSATVRLIPFIFNSSQTYVLEFGNQYLRVIKNGAYQVLSSKTISGITNANPAVVTATSHGYSNGDEVAISGVLGMSELNGRNFKIANVTTNSFSLKSMDGTSFSSVHLSTYVSGGVSNKVYQIATPYVTADLPTLKYVQSADVVTIAHPNYPPAEIKRTGDTSWTLSNVVFAPSISAPTGLDSNGPDSTGASTDISYAVTAIAAETFEESLASSSTTIGFPTSDDQAILLSTTLGAGPATLDGTLVSAGSYHPGEYSRQVTVVSSFDDVDRTININGTDHNDQPQSEFIHQFYAGVTKNSVLYYKTVTRIMSDDNTTGSFKVGVGDTNPYPVRLTWTAVSGAQSYNIYKTQNGIYGYIGSSSSNAFDDKNALPDTTLTPPIARNPFGSTGNYPSVVSYFQQRLLFANTNNDPEKVWTSKTSNFHNFSVSAPLRSDDSVTFSLASRQVNSVQNLLDLNQLLVFTIGGEWTIQGDGNGILKPSEVNAKQHSYSGSSFLTPLVIANTALFVQSRGTIVRDLAFDFLVDSYRGNDLTIFSSHLFDNYSIVDWSYQQIPQSIVWSVRSDGTLLGLTYIREQQIASWHRHDFTNGLVENVCVVPEGNQDALYLVIKRTINGQTKRYVERFHSRQFSDVKDCVFMDASLSYDGRNTNTALTMRLTGGTTWDYTETLTLTSSSAAFSASDVGSAIHLTGSDGLLIRAVIQSYSSSTVVQVKPHKTVTTSLRGVATSSWTKALKTFTGLWHLEGQTVSVFADGFVVASPLNADYTPLVVANGSISLDQPYGVVHIGLPITSDLATLDIDSAQTESIANKKKLLTRLTTYVESSRGFFAGADEPSDGLLEGLTEFKVRDSEGYDDPVSLVTDKMDVILRAEWNSTGRIFIRQVDPLPLSILAVVPDGLIPFRVPGGGA